MDSLYEAIVLVVLVALIGFWEWRSALLIALSIPITLAMTFGLMYAAGHRPPADLDRVADHRARAAGRRPGRRGRRDQALARRGLEAAGRGVARADQAREGDPVRDHHQHRGVPAVPGADRRRRQVHLQPAGRADAVAGGVAPRVDDVHPAARHTMLLPHRRRSRSRRPRTGARRGFGRVYCARRRLGDRPPQAGVRAVAGRCSSGGGVLARRLKMAFFPKDLSYLSLRRRLAARRRPAERDARRRVDEATSRSIGDDRERMREEITREPTTCSTR